MPDVKLADLKYTVVKELGRGAGSVVKLVKETDTGRRFALKSVERRSEEEDIYLDQLEHEFDVLQRLNHQAIIKGYDFKVRKSWMKAVGADLLMEYADGVMFDEYAEALRDPVAGKTAKELAFKRIRRLVIFFANLAAALNHMHRHRVSHGDLKPGNVVITVDKKLKLIDFGTAWIAGEDKNRVQGTPEYMAPEQAGERVVNPATDLMPHPDYPMMYRSKTTPCQADPMIPRELNDLVMACLAHKPRERPESAHQVQLDLVALAETMGVTPGG